MVVLERRVAQLFRAALKRCFDSPASRADKAPVQLRSDKSGLLMYASAPEITLIYSQSDPGVPAHRNNDAFTFPVGQLGEFEGRSADPVEITSLRANRAQACWTAKGGPQKVDFTLLDPKAAPKLPELPKKFSPLPRHFLSALHDVSRATANEPTKYVINHVQLRGRHGMLVGTDTRHLLVAGGFTFPFKDDLIIPRCGAFGLEAFQEFEDVGIARTDSHVVIRVGPWMFAFLIQKEGRFPDATSIIPPSSKARTTFRLDAEDAQGFLDRLAPALKGAAGKELVVTLDLMDVPSVRFDLDGRLTEVPLPRSQVTGKRVRLCLSLPHLLRALEMRFQQFEINDPSKPIVARDGDRIYMAMPLSPPEELPPQPDAPRVPVEEVPTREMVPVSAPAVMPVILAPSVDVPARPQRSFDIIGEAEGLREGLIKVADHAGRILNFIRGVCTHQKLLDFARSSLQTLADRSSHHEAIR